MVDRHEHLQRQPSRRVRDAQPARDPHRSGPRVGRARPTDPDAVHRQRGRQRRLGDRRVALQRADHQRLPASRARRADPGARRRSRPIAAVAHHLRHDRRQRRGDDQHQHLQRLSSRWMRADTRRRSPSASTRDAVAVDAAPTPSTSPTPAPGATGTVSVFDDRTCNATDQAGCADRADASSPGRKPGRHRGQPAHRHDLRRDDHRQRPGPRSRCSTAPPATPPTPPAATRRPRPSPSAARATAQQLQSRPRRQPGDQHDLRDKRHSTRSSARRSSATAST